MDGFRTRAMRAASRLAADAAQALDAAQPLESARALEATPRAG